LRTIDLAAGTVRTERLNERCCEFAMVNPRRLRRAQDMECGAAGLRGRTGDGARCASDLVILDAASTEELAVVELPLAIPYGLHGSVVER
jgi:carotenoid cleavage dioxygenase-like enzyme